MKLKTYLFTGCCFIATFCFAEDEKEINPPANVSTDKETAYFGNGDLNGPRKHIFQKTETEEMLKAPVIIGINNPVWGYATLDFLCWRAQRTCWYYASQARGLGDDVIETDILFAHPKWKPGFRLDLNFSNIYDWTIGAVLTYFYNNSIYKEEDKFLQFSIFDQNLMNDAVVTQSKIVFISGDLELGTNFNFGKTVSVKPFVSLRAAQIKDDVNFYYEGMSDDDPPLPVTFDITTKQKFTGAGPRIGVTSEYRFGRTGLDLFGLLSASLLYGDMEVRPYSLRIKDNQDIQLSDYNQKFHDLKANIQVVLGSKWKYFWDCDTKAFMLRFAWEANYWFDQGDYFRTIEHQNQRALIFTGFNIGFGFEY